jgi:hypothetical protein
MSYVTMMTIITLVLSSLRSEKDVTYAWACVPFTGMLYNFPAKTLLVPSNPPVKIIHRYINFQFGIKCIFTHLDKHSNSKKIK